MMRNEGKKSLPDAKYTGYSKQYNLNKKPCPSLLSSFFLLPLRSFATKWQDPASNKPNGKHEDDCPARLQKNLFFPCFMSHPVKEAEIYAAIMGGDLIAQCAHACMGKSRNSMVDRYVYWHEKVKVREVPSWNQDQRYSEKIISPIEYNYSFFFSSTVNKNICADILT